MNDPVEATQQAQKDSRRAAGRPFVTLSYAQSLDGSITSLPGHPFPISGPESLTMTHRLRSVHAGLMIGIGTALADDPRLNVRLTQGDDPDPIVLDTHLRLPINSRLLSSHRSAQIFCADTIDEQRARALRNAGALLHPTPQIANGFLDLHQVLHTLFTLGYRAIMIEGGAAVITQCMQEGIFDWLVLTIAPLMLGGLRVPLLGANGGSFATVEIQFEGSALFGPDQVVWGRPLWKSQ